MSSSESVMNESEAYESDNQEMPESLKNVFDLKQEAKKINASIFTKNRATNVNTSNADIDKMAKAQDVFAKFNIFNNIKLNEKQIKPMNSVKLDKK